MSSNPNVLRLPKAASELFIGRTLLMRILVPHGNFEYDIEGALAAGQYGMAFLAARNLLYSAVRAFLINEGVVCSLADGVKHQLFELLRQHDQAGDIWREAWRLLRANPMGDDDVTSFAADCRRFAHEVLRLDRFEGHDALLYDERHDPYLELAEELGQVLDHLGVAELATPNPRKKIEARRAINRRLSGERAAGDTATTDERPAPPPVVSPTVTKATPTAALSLTADEQQVLCGLLRDYIPRVAEELTRTDTRHLRYTLMMRVEVGSRLLAQLEAATPSGT